MYLSKKLLAVYLLIVTSSFMHAEPPAPEGQPTTTSSSTAQETSSSDQSPARPSLGMMSSLARNEEHISESPNQRVRCLCAAAYLNGSNK